MVVALGPGKFYGSSLPRPRFYENPNGERVDPPVSVLDPLMAWAEEAHWSMGGMSFKRLRLQGRIEGNIKKLRAEKEKIEKKKSARKSSPDFAMNLKRKMRLIDESDDGENEDIEKIEKKKTKKRLTEKGFESSLVNVSPSLSQSPAPPAATVPLNLKRKVQLVDESEGEKTEKKKKKKKKKSAPLNLKRKMQLVDESDDENEEMGVVGRVEKRGAVRKLDDDFERVAEESGRRTRSGRNREVVVVEEAEKVKTKGKKLKKGVKNSGLVTPSAARTSPRLSKRGSP